MVLSEVDQVVAMQHATGVDLDDVAVLLEVLEGEHLRLDVLEHEPCRRLCFVLPESVTQPFVLYDLSLHLFVPSDVAVGAAEDVLPWLGQRHQTMRHFGRNPVDGVLHFWAQSSYCCLLHVLQDGDAAQEHLQFELIDDVAGGASLSAFQRQQLADALAVGLIEELGRGVIGVTCKEYGAIFMPD